jgi:hypothetical protein
MWREKFLRDTSSQYEKLLFRRPATECTEHLKNAVLYVFFSGEGIIFFNDE